MKVCGNTVVIGIDHGYGNIKTANTVTPTGLVTYNKEPTFSESILHYNGKFHRVGEGHKAFIADKTSDDEFYLLTLAAIAKEMKAYGMTSANVHIAAGLPLTWVKTQREEFRSYLSKNSEFDFDSERYAINVVGCSVFPQGYTAVINELHAMSGVNIIADIGNGTMNIMRIVDKKPVESECHTEKLGVYQCVIAAKNAVMDEFHESIDESSIEHIIRYGDAEIAQKYVDCISRVCKDYYQKIVDALRKYEYNPDLMRLYITGGGGCIVRNFGEYDKSRVNIIGDICATAKGYEQLAYAMLKKQQEG